MISLHTNNKIYFFQPEQIIRLEARSNYTKIFFSDHSTMLLAKVLKTFEVTLLPCGFLRVHRSHLINKKYIQAVSKCGEVIMQNTPVAVISRRRKGEVIKELRA